MGTVVGRRSWTRVGIGVGLHVSSAWGTSTIWLFGAVIIGLYCDVIWGIVIVVLRSLVLQDGK